MPAVFPERQPQENEGVMRYNLPSILKVRQENATLNLIDLLERPVRRRECVYLVSMVGLSWMVGEVTLPCSGWGWGVTNPGFIGGASWPSEAKTTP